MCVCVCVCACVCVRACVCACVCVTERERETDRQTDRQTNRHGDGLTGGRSSLPGSHLSHTKVAVCKLLCVSCCVYVHCISRHENAVITHLLPRRNAAPPSGSRWRITRPCNTAIAVCQLHEIRFCFLLNTKIQQSLLK